MLKKNQLLCLLANNKDTQGRKFNSVVNGIEATVYLYDVIVSDALSAEYFGGVDPLTFAQALNEIKADTIHLRINSPGGDVFAAQAMAQAIREHPANVIAHIDGVAASAATTIACACDESVISSGGAYMIHRAMMMAFGNTNDLTESASVLEKIDVIIANGYAKQTGKTTDEILAMMTAETWMNADEAVANGFIQSVAETEEQPTALWDLSAYTQAPKAIRNALKPPQKPPEPTVITDEHRERMQQRIRLLQI